MSEPDSQENERLSPEDVYERMELFEPYTTEELAKCLQIPKGPVWFLLKKLAEEKEIRKKEPKPNNHIWIRESATYECQNCEHEFQIKFLRLDSSPVHFCPQCGTRNPVNTV